MTLRLVSAAASRALGLRAVVAASIEQLCRWPNYMVAERAADLAQAQREEAARHPLIQAVLQAFPGATIDEVRSLEPAAEAAVTPQGDVPPADEPIEDEIA